MAGLMWFGNRERMGWVPCPAIEADISKVGWSASGRYLNGGGWVRRSATAGKVYQFAWNLAPKSDIRKVTDYVDGVYGPGPFYFIDPFSTDNILPSYWTAPRLAAKDGPPLIKDKRPALVDAVTYEWVDAPNDSASVELVAGREVRRNMFYDPKPVGSGFSYSGLDPLNTFDGWRRMTSNATATTFLSSRSPHNSAIPVTDRGSPVEVSMDLRAPASPGVNYQLGVFQYDVSGTEISSARHLGPATNLAQGQTTRASIMVSVGPGVVAFRVLLYVRTFGSLAYEPGNIIDWRNGFVGQPGGYFDGDSPNRSQGDYPSKSAVYTASSDDQFSEIWLPVPEGQTLHFGAHGSSGGGTVVTLTEDGKTAREAPLMGLGNDLTNTQVQGPTGVTVSLGRKTYEWEGTPNESASEERVGGTVTRRNRATHPSFQAGFGPAVGGSASLAIVTSGGYVGSNFLQATAQASTAHAANGLVTIPVTPGTGFALSAWVRGTQGKAVRFRATWTGTANNFGPIHTLTSQWQRISYSGVVPEGATELRVDVHSGPLGTVDAALGDTLDVDGLLVEMGTQEVLPYFDGDTPVDPTLTLNSMVAALVPNGDPAPTGEFPSGQGHSGVEFDGFPMVTGYSAGLDLVGATATLTEVGAWL